MSVFIQRQTVDLARENAPVIREQVHVKGDSDALGWEVAVTRNGQPETMTGYTARLYCCREDGSTIMDNAQVSGNVITAALPSDAYNVPGALVCLLQVSGAGAVAVIARMIVRIGDPIGQDTRDASGFVPITDLNELVRRCEAAAVNWENSSAKMLDGETISAVKDGTNYCPNWYFGKPVNQRNKTVYTGKIIGIDRWEGIADKCKLEVKTDSVNMSGGGFQSFLDPEKVPNDGQTMTIALLLKDGRLFSKTGVVRPDANELYLQWGNGNSFYYLRSYKAIVIGAYESPGHDILAVYIGPGKTQTIAHEEGGKWVLNRIPDYQVELTKCQRYFRSYDIVGIICKEGNWPKISLAFPPMHANPTMSVGGFYTDQSQKIEGAELVQAITTKTGVYQIKTNMDVSSAGFILGVYLSAEIRE